MGLKDDTSGTAADSEADHQDSEANQDRAFVACLRPQLHWSMQACLVPPARQPFRKPSKCAALETEQ